MALRGELSANTVAFCRLLRQRGLMIGPGEATIALQTLREIDLSSPKLQVIREGPISEAALLEALQAA